MTPCTSSLISAFEYDHDAEMLTIVFRTNNEVRHYTGFAPETFWEFEASDSKGKFFNSNIKAKYEVLKSGKVSDEQLASALESTTHLNDDGDAVVVVAPVKVVAPDLGITDDDIRAVDPAYNPVRDENLLPEEEDALAQPAKKRTEVDKVLSQWNALATTQNRTLVIADAAQYTAVAETLKRKVSIRDTVFGILDPVRAIVYKAYKDVMDRQKAILEPMDQSITEDKRALLSYDQEQQRIAREAQQKAQREAEEAQERERQRQTEELRMRVASELAETGNIEEAEASLFDESVQAPVMPVYAPRVAVETPSIAGQSSRKNWRLQEVVDFEALILDVAEGIRINRQKGSLEGHAPSTMLLPNIPALNKRAKADERINLFPGVLAFDDRVLSVKKG